MKLGEINDIYSTIAENGLIWNLNSIIYENKKTYENRTERKIADDIINKTLDAGDLFLIVSSIGVALRDLAAKKRDENYMYISKIFDIYTDKFFNILKAADKIADIDKIEVLKHFDSVSSQLDRIKFRK